MNIHGRVRNGVVVLDSPALPEGAEVTVSYNAPATPWSRSRVRLPLVRSEQPGQLRLTAEQIAELLSDDDVSA